jgi:hypothetical protein
VFKHRLICDCCGAHREFDLSRAPSNPLAIPGSAKLVGWRHNKAQRLECPRCNTESPHLPAEWQTQLAALHVVAQSNEEPKMPEKPVVGLREPTQQERIKIRQVLDQHFDDEAGCWLNGYSDQKAGEEIGLPWAMVTRIREAAYGPIRVDPEVAALRAELVQIGRELASVTEKHIAAQKRLDALTAKRAA